MALTLPPDAVVDAIHGEVTKVTRRVAFFESDGVTPWEPEGAGVSPPLIGGSVSLDQSRDERRALQGLEVFNEGGLYRPGVNSLWYDKVIKVYRGVEYGSGSSWERVLGTFQIDTLDAPHHPNVITINGRDFTKKLRLAKFASATMFPKTHPIEEVVRDIAYAGGIPLTDMNLPLTGQSLEYDYVLEAGSERWEAIKKVCTSYGYEVFFDGDGDLTMRAHQDPYSLPAEYTFKTGVDGNMVSYSKRLTDTLLRNHVVVSGENASQVPVFGEAKNTKVGSPTSIAKIGTRTHFYQSAFITSAAQAEQVALDFLQVMGLEKYELSMNSIVVPYIDVGVVVGFLDPDPVAGEPTEYLLQTVTIPLGLEPMEGTAGRVTNLNP